MNFFEGKIEGSQFVIGSGEAVYRLSKCEQLLLKKHKSRAVILGVRPEDITISSEKTSLKGVVDLIETNGAEMLVHTRVASQQIVVKSKSDDRVKMGDTIYLSFNENAIHLFDKSTKKRLKSLEVFQGALLTSS